jgi:hypothetical protein
MKTNRNDVVEEKEEFTVRTENGNHYVVTFIPSYRKLYELGNLGRYAVKSLNLLFAITRLDGPTDTTIVITTGDEKQFVLMMPRMGIPRKDWDDQRAMAALNERVQRFGETKVFTNFPREYFGPGVEVEIMVACAANACDMDTSAFRINVADIPE